MTLNRTRNLRRLQEAPAKVDRPGLPYQRGDRGSWDSCRLGPRPSIGEGDWICGFGAEERRIAREEARERRREQEKAEKAKQQKG
jgi:hypothetical protein